MLAVQLEDAASDDPQVLLKVSKSPGSAPVNPMLLIVIAVVPLFVSVTTFCAPFPPTGTDTQFRVVGETETCANKAPGSRKHAAATRALHVFSFSCPEISRGGVASAVKDVRRKNTSTQLFRDNAEASMDLSPRSDVLVENSSEKRLNQRFSNYLLLRRHKSLGILNWPDGPEIRSCDTPPPHDCL